MRILPVGSTAERSSSRHRNRTRLAVIAGAALAVAGIATTAFAATLSDPAPIQIQAGPAAQPPKGNVKTPGADHRDAPLVAAFEQVNQNTVWTKSGSIPQTWQPAGVDYEQEGFKYYNGRYYISVYDHTANDGHLVILDKAGTLIKDIAFVDGARTHAGGFEVYGDYAYVPLAVDSAHSSADILRINIKTYQVETLFTVGYDHVGGVIYDPVKKTLVGQSWDSRTFYEWTLKGKLVGTWQNPSDYVGYQDCQYVPYEKMLCSGASEGIQSHGGFDLIDLKDPDHAILNGYPTKIGGGNANEILATPTTDGVVLTQYDAGGSIDTYTTTIHDAD
ncbi:DUF6454 family protein [Amycolatopsis carbonis]|uniref:DUF6454 family protein n=1 Tax=Amycolatopsis carbonis TaxID=715471 RepID=A0A9Y2MUB4_9PSEU|nr:DUF6454 family protein [Amycolatopsis sp. 2-15]WIX75492.1 DUF6454 family protein [Amycolatopsis sp. 2-15]